jgi:hypothetical protein
MKRLKEIPKFKTEDEERKFWADHDSTEFVDWDAAELVSLPNLKPTMKTISLRLPEFMLNELRLIARKRDISYHALIKIFLKERIDHEFNQGSIQRKAPATPA